MSGWKWIASLNIKESKKTRRRQRMYTAHSQLDLPLSGESRPSTDCNLILIRTRRVTAIKFVNVASKILPVCNHFGRHGPSLPPRHTPPKRATRVGDGASGASSQLECGTSHSQPPKQLHGGNYGATRSLCCLMTRSNFTAAIHSVALSVNAVAMSPHSALEDT